jgi:holo-[acyl-carrier protein] synthase
MVVGIGIDVVDIARMKLAISRTPRIIEKILTQNERNTIEMSDDRRVEYVAGRFAVKEAFVKSLGRPLFEVGLHAIEILNDESGAPVIHCINLPNEQNLSFLCSLTHSQHSAAAVVIAQVAS